MDSEEQGQAARSIVEAFAGADLVCVGEAHQLRDLGDFLGSLIREPGFAEACNDIVVECGNSRYQETADRFVAGEDVPPRELLGIWRDTTQPGVWDSPVYGQFFVRVREANRALPPENRLRVLLGGPPINWDEVQAPADLAPFAAVREAHFAAILESHVLRRKRKALFWAGGSHVVRRPETVPNPVVLIEKRGTGTCFIVLTHAGFTDDALETRLAAWPTPSLLRLHDSWLGHVEATAYFQEVQTLAGSRPNPYARVRLEEAADAYLFLGTRGQLTRVPPPEDIYDGDYGDEVKRRKKLIAGLAGLVGRR